MSVLGLFDYPKEIKQMQNQLPQSDRDAVMATYKKLSGKNKDSFKQALRNADIAGASAILNKDLTQYNLSSNTTATKGHTNSKEQGVATFAADGTIINGVNNQVVETKGGHHTHTHTNTHTNAHGHTHISPRAQGVATFAADGTIVNGVNNQVVVAATILPAEVARRYAVGAPISSSSISQTKAPVANQATLVRIDASGVFAFPDKTSMANVKAVLLNGKVVPEDKYALIDNGNLDVFESDKNSVVSVVLN